MDSQIGKDTLSETLEDQNLGAPDKGSDEETLPNKVDKSEVTKDQFEIIFTAIENAFTYRRTKKKYAFPLPVEWIGPRFLASWILPIYIINKVSKFIKSMDFVKPYNENTYKLENPETIYTATNKSFAGYSPMRFLGARFIAIWILPMGITGLIMELLFVSPLRNVSPFN